MHTIPPPLYDALVNLLRAYPPPPHASGLRGAWYGEVLTNLRIVLKALDRAPKHPRWS